MEPLDRQDSNPPINPFQTEVEDWFLSLVPLGVAFAFFIIFLLPMEIPNKDLVVVAGIAAGLVGFESYWIVRGWRKRHVITILLGLLGTGATLGLAWLYLNFF